MSAVVAEKYSPVRAEGREHIPLLPKGFFAIRIIQLVFTLIILALSAYGVSISSASGIVFILVVALMTLITSIYHIVAETGAPKLYNYWAVMSLDILLVIMWLSAFALLAAAVAVWAAETGSGYYYYGVYYYYSGYSKAWTGALGGAAAIGAIEFILHLVALIITSVAIHRHRSAGLHCTPGAPRTLPGQGPPGGPIVVPVVAAPAPVAFANPAEKPQQAYPQQNVYPVQQAAAPPVYPPQTTMTPPPNQPYAVPQQPVQPTPYYPQQAPPPLVTQHTGGSYVQQQQGIPVQHPPMPQQQYQAVPYQGAPAQ
ncbi:hypothetical protein GQ53DRAFT_836425 [Thozetella sp. PMI_491]|nr:hypothetical protein GQ53DRAFT_836425 [Thozetella sp. PMI_491]